MSANNASDGKDGNNKPKTITNGNNSSSPPSTSWLTKCRAHVKYEHLMAGVVGGVTSTLVLHPLDLLKIRLAVNDGQVSARPHYRGLVNAVNTIVTQEGVKGLYKGVIPNCWGAGASWGFYFLFYNSIKSRMNGDNKGVDLGPGSHLMAAAMAGLITTTITNPIWVVKTQMCLQYTNVSEVQTLSSKRYTGMVDVLRRIYQYEGISGLYRGYVPGILNVSHGALQFMAYEELKKYYILKNKLKKNAKLETIEYLTCASLSKLFAATITYPYQLLRARLQDQHTNYKGLFDVIRKTWRYERLGGFYSGLGAYLIHVTPNICIVFTIYEKLSPTTAQSKSSRGYVEE